MFGKLGGRNRPVSALIVLVVALLLAPALGHAAAAQDQVELSVWTYLPPDDPSVKAYIEQFQAQNPNVRIKYTAFPEDDYTDKVRTALTAHNPPDVALIEDRQWMKAGLVVELSDQYKEWGVDPADFNAGALTRLTPEGKLDQGIYAVGDFLGGNVLFYNKKLLDEAGVDYPSDSQSLTWSQYDELCRKAGKPDRNPTKAVFGCSAPFWGFGIWSKWVWGDDGRTALGNMNSDAQVQAWNLGSALVRDGYAPNASLLDTLPAGVSDLFAQGRVAITWSDFTDVTKYEANGVDFGLAPFVVQAGSESFVDTWTSPWGTFTESKRPDEALAFLRFIATDGQRIRAETSADPPLSYAVAQELGWGKDDPVKQQYLTVLQQAKPQVFVPESFLPEDVYDRQEIFRKLTVGGQTDAKPVLDAEAAKAQPAIDEAWKKWEALAPDAGG